MRLYKIKCDTCGKEIDLWNAYDLVSQDGRRLKVCKDCKNMEVQKGKLSMPATNNTWEYTTKNEVKRKRPSGITFLAILQIIETLIIIGVLVAIPILLEGKTIQLLGEPLFYFLIIYAMIMIPISLLLAYGLLKGREWARFYTRFFQLINIISALLRFNILGIFIPIYILIYLGKPHVLQFFDKKSPLDSRFWPLVIIGVIALLIVSSSLAFYTNPLVQENILKNNAISSREALLIGTWHNTDGTIVLTFNPDHTCGATKDDLTYNGTWEIEKHFYWVELNWETAFQLKHPNNPALYYTIEQVYFIGHTLSLYTMFESPSYYICTKIS